MMMVMMMSQLAMFDYYQGTVTISLQSGLAMGPVLATPVQVVFLRPCDPWWTWTSEPYRARGGLDSFFILEGILGFISG